MESIITPDQYKAYAEAELKKDTATREQGNLSLSQFFELMFYTLDIVKPEVVFAPAYPRYLLPKTEEYKKTMENPTDLFKDTITYMVTREEPGCVGGDKQPFGTGRRELRHRIREILEAEAENKSRIQYGQWFDTLVQFDCWSLTNYESARLVLWFKQFMSVHRDFFKSMGLSEIFFWWRGKDTTSAVLNNDLHYGTIVYYIRTEDLSFEKDYDIQQLKIQLETKMQNS